jgi:hypothetical protein
MYWLSEKISDDNWPCTGNPLGHWLLDKDHTNTSNFINTCTSCHSGGFSYKMYLMLFLMSCVLHVGMHCYTRSISRWSDSQRW